MMSDEDMEKENQIEVCNVKKLDYEEITANFKYNGKKGSFSYILMGGNEGIRHLEFHLEVNDNIYDKIHDWVEEHIEIRTEIKYDGEILN